MDFRMSAKELDRLELMREIEQGQLSRRQAARLLRMSERPSCMAMSTGWPAARPLYKPRLKATLVLSSGASCMAIAAGSPASTKCGATLLNALTGSASDLSFALSRMRRNSLSAAIWPSSVVLLRHDNE